MQLPCFYEPSLTEDDIFFTLTEETKKHAITVLRLKQNEAIHLTNGKGLFCRAFIENINKKEVTVKVETVKFHQEANTKISIAISLLKNSNRFEWFLEKATELGISAIFPLLCDRTERQHFRYDRMQSILISAMLQSEQTWLPMLYKPMSVQHLLDYENYPFRLIAHCQKAEKILLSKLEIKESTIILIGPEGDFTDTEINLALSKNYLPVSLGNTRLRTETAGVVAATVLINNIK